MPSPAEILDAYTQTGRCLRATATVLRIPPDEIADVVRQAAADYGTTATDLAIEGAADIRLLSRLAGELAQRCDDPKAATAAIKAIEVRRTIAAELAATIARETGSDAERDALASQVQALIDARAEELAALTGPLP